MIYFVLCSGDDLVQCHWANVDQDHSYHDVVSPGPNELNLGSYFLKCELQQLA